MGKIRKFPNKMGVFGDKKNCVGGLTAGRVYSILGANQGACRALRNNKPRPAEPGRNEGKMKMNVWHDDGDDGVTGWQPIGEPLIRTTRAPCETTTPRPARPGRNEETK